MSGSKLYILLAVVILVCVSLAVATDTLYQNCTVTNPPTAGGCPSSYCCVRDEFVPTLAYCQQIGRVGDRCSVRPSINDCPCDTGLTCKPNIQTAVFVSMFGRCASHP